MAYVTRQGKGSRMSIQDLDGTLNYLYTASANAATSSISASYAATASYVNGIESYTYVEVPISSAQILSMSSSPIELLPNSGTNNYYDIEKIIFEYTYGSSFYTFSQIFFRVEYNNNELAKVSTDFFGVTEDALGIILFSTENDSSNSINYFYPNSGFLNKKLRMFVTGGNPTGGDGTILAKIWYKLKTFGTEL